MAAAISFERVSKHYRGARSYRAMRDDMVSLGNRLLGRGRGTQEAVVRALDGVTFDIEQGTSTAIIGLNGAGKTTALKIISRITYPTDGVVRVTGRVGALIEVGTGMHPELTGRENVRLYGRILGHTPAEIARRFDDIVDFAGIGNAIDQPVKQYSSGMQLRLGFAVASFLEPDVFLVDEAIAVGDAGFQYRCVERMTELVREGRTLIFVSHDMSAIETLCDRAILLEEGKVAGDGPASEVVRHYLANVQADLLADESVRPVGGEGLEIERVSLHADDGTELDEFVSGRPMTVRVHFRARRPIPQPMFSIGLSDGRGGCFTLASMLVDGKMPDAIAGVGHVDCTFAELPLRPKAYEIWGSVRGESGFGDLVDWQRLRRFRITAEGLGQGKGAVTHSMTDAPVIIPYEWRTVSGG